MGTCQLIAIFILLRLSRIYPVLALPDLVVRITPTSLSQSDSPKSKGDENDASIDILAKRATFGSRDHFLTGILVRPPDYDPLLCERYEMSVDIFKNGNLGLVTLPPYPKPDEKNSTVMLVPRGECSFERKAYAAKHFYGAKGILIYDRLAARYTWNETTNRVNFPRAISDYECGNGNAVMHNLTLDPPMYDETKLDPLLGLTTKMTTKTETRIGVTNNEDSLGQGSNAGSTVGMTTNCDLTNTALNPCESNLCLVTSHTENSTKYPVCCAWDIPFSMPEADDAKNLDTSNIFAVFLTIRQSELIFKSDLLSFKSDVSIETRGSHSAFNTTYIFMWMWGTLVTMIGAWYAAGDYRSFGAKLTAYKASEEMKQTGVRDRGGFEADMESGEQSFQDELDGGVDSKDTQQTIRGGSKQKKRPKKEQPMKAKQNEKVWSLHSLPPPERKRKQNEKRPKRKNNDNQHNKTGTKESNTGEIENETSTIPSRESEKSTSFEMTTWHVLGFVIMASLTLIILYFWKMYTLIFILYGIGCAGAISSLIFNPLVATTIPKFGDSWVEEFNKPVICGRNGFSVTSQLIAYLWTAVWIWYGITHYRPETTPFFWVTLNIFGACFCALAVSMLRLNSIKIAAILLTAIFFYDIFFVFITPFFTGGTSVMLQVAAGSQDPDAGEFCFKYPDDRYCKGIGFLPMLFIFPKINDYARGSVLLGLGDIILPGFLIAFSARHDEAARLIGAHMTNLTNPDVRSPSKWYDGYFFPMLIAYSMGLFFAFLAVILMEQGQPALLYICPICLTAILTLGRRDIKDLWNGAKVFKLADRLISKTERDWGKARMKNFAERRRRENAGLSSSNADEVGPDKQSTGRSKETIPEKPSPPRTGSTPVDHVQPRATDICFGSKSHPGTKEFRTIVEEVAADLGEEDYKPEIYKVIRRKLKGRRFLMKNSNSWVEASKLETRKQIGRAFDRARGKPSAVLKD